VSLIAAPIAFGISAISFPLAVVYFGKEFSATGLILKYLSFVIIFASIANVIRTQYLIPKNKNNIYVISMILAAIVNFVLNIYFIPMYGANGAIIGTCVSEFTVMAVQLYGCRKELPIFYYVKKNCVYYLFGLVMFLVVSLVSQLFPYSFIFLVIEILLGIIIYFAFLILYAITKKDTLLLNIYSNFMRKIK